jgi:hypothetical protein
MDNSSTAKLTMGNNGNIPVLDGLTPREKREAIADFTAIAKGDVQIDSIQLPIMTGTEKQISFASDIKKQMIERWNKDVVRLHIPQVIEDSNGTEFEKKLGHSIENLVKAKDNLNKEFLQLTDSAKVIKIAKSEKFAPISDAMDKSGWKTFF